MYMSKLIDEFSHAAPFSVTHILSYPATVSSARSTRLLPSSSTSKAPLPPSVQRDGCSPIVSPSKSSQNWYTQFLSSGGLPASGLP